MRNTIVLLSFSLLLACTQQDQRFEQLPAEKTGIDFVNTITESDSFNILNNEYMYNGGGVGVGDLNDDGLPDLVFAGNQVASRIYLNQGDFRFRDITDAFAGLNDEQWFSGVTIVDINADGRLDVYLTATTSKDPEQRKNRLWVNQGMDAEGALQFTEMAESYGIADTGYSVHAGFLDYDLDGDLDLYILNNIVGRDIPTNYRPKMVDGSAPNNDKLYQNVGNGKFKDVTQEAGIVYEGFGLGLAIGDVNKDGYPDIYVSNDYIANDLLYINQQDGTFRNSSPDYLSYQSKFSMGNDMADVNNDGNPDIITLDMLPEAYYRKKQTINGNSYYFYVNDDKYGYERQYVRNMLHLHNGFRNGEMLPYSEVGQMMGVFQTEWSWSPLFADFDNDGDRDLAITNGFPKDLTDKDFTNYKAQVHGFVASDQQVISKIPVVKVSNYIYENEGDYRFSDRTKEWGLSIPSFSNGAAFVDLDNDGDLDYVVNNIDDPAFIYRNHTAEQAADPVHYLRIKLEGEAPNTQAIGAKVELWSGDQYQYHEQYLSRGYISSVDPVVHFGLGDREHIDSIRVIWPGGNRQSLLNDVKADQLITVREKEARTAPGQLRPVANQSSLFAERTDLIDYQHQEEDYIDFFQRQRIIPHKFSQIGPCMTKGDVNGDGQEDLLIGANQQLPTTVYLQQAGRFVPAQFPGLTETKAVAESDLAVVDWDGDGDQDVIALAGGYHNDRQEDYQHFYYEQENGTFTRRELPLPPFPASVVRVLDYDHDGDPDLFVGARVQRDGFPLAPESYVVTNDNGDFSVHPALSFDLGMVTDAIWSDYDGDGWEDLVIAREWNTIAILQNQQGRSFQVVDLTDLSEKKGVWSTVVAGDFDGDGDDDYLLGNLGENHRFTVSNEHPMGLYAIDIDQNGVIDPISTAYWKDKEGKLREYPINYLDELAAQSPFFRKKFTSYTSFSYMPIDSILDKQAIPADRRFTINTTSSYTLWNEGGNFTWERLPARLQMAPIKEVLVRDLNTDGHLDVLVAGNDHTYDVSTGYYDANKGIVMLGQGDRHFKILSPAESGLLLQGQISCLLYFESHTSLLVAGVNRGPVVVYRHLLE